MDDAKKRPRMSFRLLPRLFGIRRKAMFFSLACYTFAFSGVLSRAVVTGQWQDILLAVSSVWIPISILVQWRAWRDIDRLMDMGKALLAQVALEHHVVHPIALFVTQVDKPDAEGDVRNVGHGKVNIRELRN